MKSVIIILSIYIISAIAWHNTKPQASAGGKSKIEAIESLLRNYDASIKYYNVKKKLITITINDESLTCATDGCCEAAANLFYLICSIDKDLILLVEASFVASSVNPMDYEWAKFIAEDNEPFHPLGYETYQRKVLIEIQKRTRRWI